MSHTFWIAVLGGTIACAATAMGSALASHTKWRSWLNAHLITVDFALGLMLSAAAFSLVGPLAIKAWPQTFQLQLIGLGLYFGVLLVCILRKQIRQRSVSLGGVQSGHLLLVLVLMVHNFPEGLASGAGLIGLSLNSAVSILGSIALQNIPEGMMMVLSLRSLGLDMRKALWGGILSGLVELSGGLMAGVLVEGGTHILPFLLALAGGAMFTSSVIEILESGSWKERLFNRRFATGMLSIPLLNTLLF